MRPRDQTDDRPALTSVLVLVVARDEQEEISGALSGIAAAAAGAGLPVVVSVVQHRCRDGTADRVGQVVDAHSGCTWVVTDSKADTLGGARSDGVRAAATHPALAGVDPAAVWVASTDVDSRVPPTWLSVQRDLADRGLDLVLGTVEPQDDGSEPVRLWLAHPPVEGHLGVHGANLGMRLSAYERAGGFPALDVGEDAQLVHAIRHGAGMPWTSTVRIPVVTSARRQGRRRNGLSRFLLRLDDAVDTFGASPALLAQLRGEVVRLAAERGSSKTLCPSEAAGALDPARRQELTHLARAMACTLADEAKVVITQKGVPVDGRRVSGPVRVGLPPPQLR